MVSASLFARLQQVNHTCIAFAARQSYDCVPHECIYLYTKVGFTIHHHGKRCKSDTMLSTIKECSNAKAVIDPTADAVRAKDSTDAPKGCSRYQGEWFFNTHKTGAYSSVSDSVCKATSGSSCPAYLRYAFGSRAIAFPCNYSLK